MTVFPTIPSLLIPCLHSVLFYLFIGMLLCISHTGHLPQTLHMVPTEAVQYEQGVIIKSVFGMCQL